MSTEGQLTIVVLESSDFAEVKALESLLSNNGIAWATERVKPSVTLRTPTKRVMVAATDRDKAVGLAAKLSSRRERLKRFAPAPPKNGIPLPDEIWPPHGAGGNGFWS